MLFPFLPPPHFPSSPTSSSAPPKQLVRCLFLAFIKIYVNNLFRDAPLRLSSYDLSQGILTIPIALHPLSSTSAGMAAQMSLPLLGRHIDGIWHTSIIVYNREWQYIGGIVSGIPQPTLMGM